MIFGKCFVKRFCWYLLSKDCQTLLPFSQMLGLSFALLWQACQRHLFGQAPFFQRNGPHLAFFLSFSSLDKFFHQSLLCDAIELRMNIWEKLGQQFVWKKNCEFCFRISGNENSKDSPTRSFVVRAHVLCSASAESFLNPMLKSQKSFEARWWCLLWVSSQVCLLKAKA